MGNAFSGDDSVETTHQSGFSRLANAMCLAVCVAPLLMIAMICTVGWNEKRAVCEAKALDAGHRLANEVGCSSSSQHSGSLIFGTCDLQKSGTTPSNGGGDFSQLTHAGTGLRSEARIFCCVEEKSSETHKDKVGGGSTTVTKYRYHKGWVSYTDFTSKCRTNFHSSGDATAACGLVQNPSSWPSGAPISQTKYAGQIKVGPYAIQEPDMISQIKLDTPMTEWSAPPSWKADSAGSFSSTKWCSQLSTLFIQECIGAVQVSFYSNDWAHKSITFAGDNAKGVISKWTAPNAWLCSGFAVGNLKEGTLSKDKFFGQLQDESNGLTWTLRLVGFIFLWVAFALCFGPCEALLDCIPCIGPMLGDCFSGVVCCVACMPATVCFLGIAGAMWCVMRPLIGIPLMVLWVLFMGGLLYYVYNRRDEIGKPGGAVQQGFASQNPSYGTAAAQPGFFAPQPVMTQPTPMPRQMQVMVPPGSGPGDMVQVVTPEGFTVQAVVPPGIPPGGAFLLSY